jgi:hypothetical protein
VEETPAGQVKSDNLNGIFPAVDATLNAADITVPDGAR